MAQAEINPLIPIKGEAVDRYVKAFVWYTGSDEPPFEAVTAAQMKVLIRAVMNRVYANHKRETEEEEARAKSIALPE